MTTSTIKNREPAQGHAKKEGAGAGPKGNQKSPAQKPGIRAQLRSANKTTPARERRKQPAPHAAAAELKNAFARQLKKKKRPRLLEVVLKNGPAALPWKKHIMKRPRLGRPNSVAQAPFRAQLGQEKEENGLKDQVHQNQNDRATAFTAALDEGE